MSDLLSVASLSFLKPFAFSFLALSFAFGHCVNVHGISFWRDVPPSGRSHECSDCFHDFWMRVQGASFSTRCCATVALSLPTMTDAASISSGMVILVRHTIEILNKRFFELHSQNRTQQETSSLTWFVFLAQQSPDLTAVSHGSVSSLLHGSIFSQAWPTRCTAAH